MDKKILKEKAVELERLISKYSKQNDEAHALFKMLHKFIDNSKEMNYSSPLEWRDIPGGRLFSEGSLTKYPDLEQAFSEFRIELTGGESPALRKLKSRTENKNDTHKLND